MEVQDGLDELFRNKLEEGHAPVPSFSWDAIQEKVALEKEKKSKKLPVPFLWMAASFVTGLVASGLFFYQYQLETENHYLKELALQNKKEQLSPIEHITTEQTDMHRSFQELNSTLITERKSVQEVNSTTTSEASPTISSTPSVSSSLLTVQTSPIDQEQKKDTHLASARISKKRVGNLKDQTNQERILSISKEGNTSKSFSTVSSTSLTTQHSPSGQEKQKEYGVAPSLIFNGKPSKQNVGLASLTSSSNKKRHATASKSEKPSSSTHIEEGILTTRTQAENTATASSLAASSVEADKMDNNSLKNDSLLAAVLDSMPKKEVEMKKPVKEKEQPKKEPRLFGLPITLGVYVAPEWASRSLKFAGNEDPELVTYKKNDQHKFGFSAGISLDLKLPERFYLRTGLNYWNVGDQNHTVIKTASGNKTTNANTIKSNGQPSMVADTAGFGPNKLPYETSLSSISFKEFSSKVENNYHYIGLPALLGMKLGRSKLSAGIYSGVLVNVLLSPSRSVYYVYYDPNNPDQYTESYRELSRFSLTYWGGIDIDYKLSKNWSINLSPNVKYSLTALYKDRETVRQLPYSFGVQVGCKYSF